MVLVGTRLYLYSLLSIGTTGIELFQKTIRCRSVDVDAGLLAQLFQRTSETVNWQKVVSSRKTRKFCFFP